MRRLMFLLGFVIVALLIAAGCGDDDCPNCPAEVDTVYLPEERMVWADGYIALWPYTWVGIDCFGNGGAIPRIDSFAVGDSVSTESWHTWWWHESDPYIYLDWSEDETEPFMYESGDLATVTIWGNNMSGSAAVVILDYDDDATDMVVPSGSDTIVPPGNEMEFSWLRVANAEWYGIELLCQLDTGFVPFEKSYYSYTFDTVFTVPSTMDNMTVLQADIWVLPTTGPDPESGLGNWEGDYVTGKLYSVSQTAYSRVAFVGPAQSVPRVINDQSGSPRTPESILRGLRSTYK